MVQVNKVLANQRSRSVFQLPFLHCSNLICTKNTKASKFKRQTAKRLGKQLIPSY